MATIERFRSLAEVRAEKQRLLAISNDHQERLAGHWELLRSREFRGGLARDGMMDLVRSWQPLRAITDLFGMARGNSSEARNGAPSLKKELLAGLASTLLPILVRHFLTPERMEQFAHAWQRIMERVKNAQEDPT